MRCSKAVLQKGTINHHLQHGYACGEGRAVVQVVEGIEEKRHAHSRRDHPGFEDIPINAIHMQSGLKADLYPVHEGDKLRQSAFRRRQQVDYDPPIGKVYIHSLEDLIIYRLMYFGLSQ